VHVNYYTTDVVQAGGVEVKNVQNRYTVYGRPSVFILLYFILFLIDEQ